MKHTLSCFASYGSGGLGQHFKQMIEAAREQEQLVQYCSFGVQPGDTHGTVIAVPFKRAIMYTPLRYSPSWLSYLECELFDRAVASQLPKADVFQGFVGQSLRSFRAARRLGYQKLTLEAANSHVDNVMAQHHKAIQRFGIEQSWLNKAQRQKTLREYEMADVINVASEYTRQSFLAAGVPDSKLVKRELQVNPRYQPRVAVDDGIFRVVYVGSLTVMKGISILLEAFSRLPDDTAELILVGSWATRGMKRYLKAWLDRDPRIKLMPGDPLPHLQRASVYVHPTYEDGFAYSAAEALACGVPVIVTEDTGMKELIQVGKTGYIVPTGNYKLLLEKLIFLGEIQSHSKGCQN